jgi:hypothetical protein
MLQSAVQIRHFPYKNALMLTDGRLSRYLSVTVGQWWGYTCKLFTAKVPPSFYVTTSGCYRRLFCT